MRARFLPKFWSPCMRGIRSCGCRGTSSLQTSRSASSDRRFQRPRVPLEGAEKFSRVAPPAPLTFYTDYFTRIIYIAFYFPLSRVLVFRRKDARLPQTCDSIDRSVISTLATGTFKKKLFFSFLFCAAKITRIHTWMGVNFPGQRVQFVFVAEITGTKFILNGITRRLNSWRNCLKLRGRLAWSIVDFPSCDISPKY